MHNQWSDPTEFRPERFMPGGEYDQFDEAVRGYMFLPFIQVGGVVGGLWRCVKGDPGGGRGLFVASR